MLLECVLPIKPTFIKTKTIHVITHTAVLNGIILLLWTVLKSVLGQCKKQQRMKKKLSRLNDQFLNLLSVTGLLYHFTFTVLQRPENWLR